MMLFSTCIILKRQVGPSVAILATVISGQAVAYGLVFDLVSIFHLYIFFFIKNKKLMKWGE